MVDDEDGAMVGEALWLPSRVGVGGGVTVGDKDTDVLQVRAEADVDAEVVLSLSEAD